MPAPVTPWLSGPRPSSHGGTTPPQLGSLHTPSLFSVGATNKDYQAGLDTVSTFWTDQGVLKSPYKYRLPRNSFKIALKTYIKKTSRPELFRSRGPNPRDFENTPGDVV